MTVIEQKIKELESKIKTLEQHAQENEIKYPIYTEGKMWVSATHWYYN